MVAEQGMHLSKNTIDYQASDPNSELERCSLESFPSSPWTCSWRQQQQTVTDWGCDPAVMDFYCPGGSFTEAELISVLVEIMSPPCRALGWHGIQIKPRQYGMSDSKYCTEEVTSCPTVSLLLKTKQAYLLPPSHNIQIKHNLKGKDVSIFYFPLNVKIKTNNRGAKSCFFVAVFSDSVQHLVTLAYCRSCFCLHTVYCMHYFTNFSVFMGFVDNKTLQYAKNYQTLYITSLIGQQL